MLKIIVFYLQSTIEYTDQLENVNNLQSPNDHIKFEKYNEQLNEVIVLNKTYFYDLQSSISQNYDVTINNINYALVNIKNKFQFRFFRLDQYLERLNNLFKNLYITTYDNIENEINQSEKEEIQFIMPKNTNNILHNDNIFDTKTNINNFRTGIINFNKTLNEKIMSIREEMVGIRRGLLMRQIGDNPLFFGYYIYSRFQVAFKLYNELLDRIHNLIVKQESEYLTRLNNIITIG